MSESKQDGATSKMAYEAPVLERIGSLEAVTQATGGTSSLDQAFPAHTPFNQLTFS